MKPPSVRSDQYGSQRPVEAEVRAALQRVNEAVDVPEVTFQHPIDSSTCTEWSVQHTNEDDVTPAVTSVRAPLISDLQTSLSRVTWRLYLALLLTKLIPTLYRTTRVYYLGDLPSDSGVNIASQLTWVTIFLEVVQESLILPLYYMIGVTIDDENETRNRVKTGILFTVVVHIVFSAIIVAAAFPLVRFMAQDVKLLHKTVTYIRFEMAAVPCNSVVQFVTVVFTLYKWQFHIYSILAMRLILSILLDTFFLSSFHFSLQLGVNGIAYGNIITNGVIAIYCIIILLVKFRTTCQSLFSKMSFSWMKKWGTVGFYSGLDSFVRNLFYAICVVRMMNVISEQGTYWLANEFIWNWLLIAFLPLSDVLKQDTGASTSPVVHHRVKTAGYTILTVIIGLLWCASIPAWKPFLKTVMNIPENDVDAVFQLILILMPAYIVFMVNTLMDSVFIGKGRTGLLPIQSIITNICIFGVSFVLFLCDVYEPTLINISVLFASGIVVDFMITTILYIWFINKIDYEI
ncbi:uncharacterized protein [Apostichopus japonicus]|uniref:uncharacterized protein n=1 Tax=Stichopus japonicus TaxID=307972 RepID=UPI003AB4D8F7